MKSIPIDPLVTIVDRYGCNKQANRPFAYSSYIGCGKYCKGQSIYLLGILGHQEQRRSSLPSFVH